MEKKSKEKPDKILKELVIESIKDIENIFQGIGSMYKNLWGFFTNPNRVFGVLKSQNIDLLYDKFLKNEKLLKILAFIVALLLVVSTYYEPSDSSFSSSVSISDYPLRTYSSPDYVIVDGAIPETVNLFLSGDRNQIELAQAIGSFEIYVDLRSLSEGTHQVEIKYADISDRINVTITPSSIPVTLDRLVEESRQVRADFVNEDLLSDFYVLGTTVLSMDTVKVRGAESIVSEVASVKALIDVSDVDQLNGYEAPVVAFDRLGNRLNVDIIPDTVTASVDVQEHSTSVPFEVSITGNPPEGYSISEIIVEPEEVRLFGERTLLDTIEYFPISIDLYQLNSENEVWIDLLELMDDVQTISEERVKVTVKYEETETRTWTDISIKQRNINVGYEARLEETNVDLILSGAPTILDHISEDSLDVFINLSGLEAGEHEVLIEIKPIDFVIIELNKNRVRVNIIG